MQDVPSATPPSRPPKGRWGLPVAAAILGLLALGVLWLWRPRPAPDGTDRAEPVDPRLSFPTPYRNVRPDVQYAGDRACADCHQDVAASFRQHPMGRALAPVAAAPPIERFDKAAHNPFAAPDPFVGGGLHYGVSRRDKHVRHREWAADPDGKVLAEAEAEVHFVVGSGKAARSYLVNHDGYLFESPVTWFPQAGRWDLSPGYENTNLHFSRPVTPGCLFCHSNFADHVPDTVNRYRPPVFRGFAVGCERCHGPGELHVRRHTEGKLPPGPDDTIVNPARLKPDLREAVCQQCHLQGEKRIVRRGGSDFDYRPGLPLHAFLMDFVVQQEGHSDAKFVNSVEQMMASRCYRASREPKKLGCISCHDPHKLPAAAERVAFYRQRCLQCHAEIPCSLPLAERHARDKEDSCVACHMPRNGSEIGHAAITDHRVPRRPEPKAKAGPAVRTLPPDRLTLVPFHGDRVDLKDAEASRNYGLALVGMLDYGPPDELSRRLAAQALPLLDAAVKRDRLDAAAWDAQGTALWTLERRPEALAAYETALSVRPDQENTLYLAG